MSAFLWFVGGVVAGIVALFLLLWWAGSKMVPPIPVPETKVNASQQGA